MLRCHACNVRFLRAGNSLAQADHLRRRFRRLAIVLAVLAGTTLVLGLILWLGPASSPLDQEGRVTPRGVAGGCFDA
jgi:hypothetical protein